MEQQPPFELTIGSTGYATFYDSEARQLPEGLTAYKVESVSDSNIQLTDIALENIPAETGVLLHGAEGTYYLWSRPGDGSIVMGNMLYGTVTEQAITTPIGNYYYYKLANDSTKGLGWYWDAENGSPFTNGAHKAYLAVPIGAGIKSFIPLYDDETGLEEMVNGQWSMVNGLNGKCYDLLGRKIVNCKLSNCQIPPGIYIINGEKVVK